MAPNPILLSKWTPNVRKYETLPFFQCLQALNYCDIPRPR